MSKQPIVQDIFTFIDQIAPFEAAESWDNVGLLIGSAHAAANKVLLALDITEEVVEEAIFGHFNLIVTHHPIIFTGIKSIIYEDRLGNMLLKLIQHNISVIAAHTNLDRSFEYGINRAIANLYLMQKLQPINAQHRFGVVGKLSEAMSFAAFIEQTKAIFGIKTVKVANHIKGPENRLIQTVAISSGASSDFIEDALNVKADVFITADLKYHEAQTVIGTDLILVDVGHFESESIYLNPFKWMLDAYAIESGLQLLVQVTKAEKTVFNFL